MTCGFGMLLAKHLMRISYLTYISYHLCAKIFSGFSNFHPLLLQPRDSHHGSLALAQVLKTRLDEGEKNNLIAWCGLS